MHELMQWYNEARHNKKIHPSVLAAFVHHRFVAIHPFDDGNGRLARILMNLILMKNGYPPAIIKLKERTDYYAALNQADKNEYVPIVEFVAEAVSESMNLYLKAARGESIEDSSDLDKEIALFKGSFEKTYKQLDINRCEKVLKEVFFEIFSQAAIKLRQFNDLFNINNGFIAFDDKAVEFDWFTNKEKHLGDIVSTAETVINWRDFNKMLQGFDFSTNLKIDFFSTYYRLTINDSNENSKIFLKFYEDIISDAEINEIANKWVRQAFDDLKKKIEEANKK